MDRWILRARKGKETHGSTEELQQLVRKKGPLVGTQLASPDGEPAGSIFFAPWLRSALIDWRVRRLHSAWRFDAFGLFIFIALFFWSGSQNAGITDQQKVWLVFAALSLASLVQSWFELFRGNSSLRQSPKRFWRELIREQRFWLHRRWKSAGAFAAVSVLLVLAPEVTVWWLTGEVGSADNALQLKLCSAALDKSAVLLNDQWWRLSSVALVHGNEQHLLFNAIGLFAGLAVLTRAWGAVAGFIVLLAGIYAGALLSFVMSPVTSVGASGGMYALVAFIVARSLREPQPPVPPAIWVGLSVAILELAILSIWIFADYFDHFGHIGGLAAGALIGLIWRPGAIIWPIGLALLSGVFVVSTGIAIQTLMAECL